MGIEGSANDTGDFESSGKELYDQLELLAQDNGVHLSQIEILTFLEYTGHISSDQSDVLSEAMSTEGHEIIDHIENAEIPDEDDIEALFGEKALPIIDHSRMIRELKELDTENQDVTILMTKYIEFKAGHEKRMDDFLSQLTVNDISSQKAGSDSDADSEEYHQKPLEASRIEHSETTDKTVLFVLKYLYDELPETERETVEIRRRVDLEFNMILNGNKKLKKKHGFTSISKHLAWFEKKRKESGDFIEKALDRKKEK